MKQRELTNFAKGGKIGYFPHRIFGIYLFEIKILLYEFFHIQHILSWRLSQENISTAIPPLPLIQEEQLSVTGKRMCTKYW